jgi:cell migration-inducing and hyaluronan-binding protein
MVPEAGESAEIKSGWNMVFDLEESPIIDVLVVNGRLTFLNEPGISLHLKVKHLFVRAGQLFIGNETVPFLGNAHITLYGEKASQAIVFTNAVEAGNKLICNTGLVKFYGQPRASKMTRLLKPVAAGASTIYVEKNLDWVAGDQIALAPTNLKYKESDYAIITSYDSETGTVQLDRTLTYGHWGKDTSTADYYGVDMRGEVALLSRNIKIQGEDIESWGGQIITGDFIEENGVWRNGTTIMDNVEVYNCSQIDTQKAAFRFD